MAHHLSGAPLVSIPSIALFLVVQGYDYQKLWKSKQMETKALIPLVGSEECLEGVITLLDQIKIYRFPNFSSWQILATLDKSSNLNTIQASMQRVYEQRKVKHATCKNVKGRVWRI